MSETPTNSTNMTREEEEEEVRTLLERHQERIRLDLANTELLAVLVKNSVLTQSEEDLLLKPHNAAVQTASAPSSVGVTKRKLSAVISNASGTSSSAGSTTSASLAHNNDNNSITNSRSASVVGDNAQSDNRSITPSVVVNLSQQQQQQQNSDNLSDLYSTKDELNHHILNDADIIRLQCANLIEIIAKNGFEKFKQFCYAIENECPQLIEDLINDRLKCGTYFLT
ncbi:uncharacterized protein LOC119601597 isoform X2 [Lucilia sericata]|uniref:uncharacterized protein LOC119601597 isoform X2 n=1 Tax=Lucilia sericata TaxID=13632 RepID=UPI0018A86421|nr:uncharacterized protein LOC119601597 isoform X2 [Lucilia sericata]